MPMSQNDNTDFYDEDQGTALAVKDDGEIVERPAQQQLTPAEAKANAIANVTMSAYAKASELSLSKEEDAALAADFPDEAFRPGAGGDSSLIYIEHAFLRDRLNNVLGRGAWALVTRSKWTEEYKTQKGMPAVRVYAEVMLMVRGCFVAEAVGEMDYYPSNAKTTYADAIEGSKTAAFRRCAKDFGIGLQAWKKGWCEGWWQRRNAPQSRQAAPQAAPVAAKAQAPVQGGEVVLAKLVGFAEGAARKGLGHFQGFWEKELSKDERILLKDHLQRLKVLALAKDKEVEGLEGRLPDTGDAYEGDGPYGAGN